MSERAFIRLNGAALNLTTGKHTKISVVGLRTILWIGRLGAPDADAAGRWKNSVVFAANSAGYG
jgi:hypothetical protein